MIGFAVLSAASVAYLVGVPLLGAALGLPGRDAGLARRDHWLLMGCWMYKIAAARCAP